MLCFRRTRAPQLIYITALFFCFSLQNAFATYYQVRHHSGKTVYLKVNCFPVFLIIKWLEDQSPATFREVQEDEVRTGALPVIEITGGEQYDWGYTAFQLTRNVRLGLYEVFSALNTRGFEQVLTAEETPVNNNERRLLVFIDTNTRDLSGTMETAARLANQLVEQGTIIRWHPRPGFVVSYGIHRITLSITGLVSEDTAGTSASGNYYSASANHNRALHQFVQHFAHQQISFSESTQGDSHTDETVIHRPGLLALIDRTGTEFSLRVLQFLDQNNLLARGSSPHLATVTDQAGNRQRTIRLAGPLDMVHILSDRPEERCVDQFVGHILINNDEQDLRTLRTMLTSLIEYLLRHRHVYTLRVAQIEDYLNGQTEISFELINYFSHSEYNALGLRLDYMPLNHLFYCEPFYIQYWSSIGVQLAILPESLGEQASTNQTGAAACNDEGKEGDHSRLVMSGTAFQLVSKKTQ